MRKILLLITMQVNYSIQYGTYKCSYIDKYMDEEIMITQEFMTERELDWCGHKYMSSCRCQMMQTLCTFGPDL